MVTGPPPVALGVLAHPQARTLVDAERLGRDFRRFLRAAWPVVERRSLVDGWHLDAIADHLTAVARGQLRDLLITIAPRHGKSTVVSVLFPAWIWTWDSGRRFLTASYAEGLAIRDAVRSRRLLDSAWYQARWADVVRLTTDQNEKRRYENDRGGARIVTSVGGSATGEGGDLLICDDPHNLRETHSDSKREAAIIWFDEIWSQRRNDPKTTGRVVIQQRMHELDIAGHVLRQGGWAHLNLPSEFEPSQRCVTALGWADPRTEEGALLCPDRIGPKEIQQAKRELGSVAYAAQHQQRPMPVGGGTLKREWWRFWTELPRHEDGRLAFDRLIQSWDCSFKDLASSDYVVGQVWGAKGADRYLLDQVRERLTFTETVRAIRRLSEKWPGAWMKLIEDKANGTAVIDTLRHELAGILPVNPEGSKEERAAAVSPLIEAGNVYLPHPEQFEWVWSLLEECALFPRAEHDDQVDAMSQALRRLMVYADAGITI